MTKNYTTIDVDPISASRGCEANASTPHSSTYTAPSFGKRAEKAAQAAANASAQGNRSAAQHTNNATNTANVTPASVIGEQPTGKKPSRLGGAVQTAVGGAIMLVGVPMLILPGPGLVAIGGGAAVAVGGIKKLLGK